MPNYKLLVCTNIRYNPKHTSCAGQGSEQLLQQLKELAKNESNSFSVEEIKCFGQCDKAPVMRIAPGLDFYYRVEEADLPKIINQLKSLK